MSKFDQLYRRIILTRFFTKGWGNPENLKRILDFRKNICNREACNELVFKDYPVHIDKDEVHGGVRILEGHFVSPFTKWLPGIMPKEVENAKFQVLLPKQWKTRLKPVCVHLAGTGDHGFWRRRTLMARPLLKEAGIASVILENPYYGVRKPRYQMRSSLHNVSDLFVMGGALVLECLVLFHWCERQGWGPLGITGVSMGGHMASAAACNWERPLSLIPCLSWSTASCIFTKMASLAATNWSKPLVLVPCLSGSTASCVFTQGVMSGSIPWEVLQSQYYGDAVFAGEIEHLITSSHPKDSSPVEESNPDLADGMEWKDAYMLGQDFVRNFPESVDRMKNIHSTSTDSEHYIVRQNKINTAEFNSAIKNVTSYNPNSDITDGHYGQSFTALESESFKVENGPDEKTKEDYHNVLTQDKLAKIFKNLPILSQRKKENYKNMTGDDTKVLKSKLPQTLEHDVIRFMTGVMDECTHLANFSVPVDTSLIIIISAKQDAYVPREGVQSLEELWPGAEVRYIDSGHVAAILFQQDVFRKAIIEAFDRQIKKYYS